MKLCIYYLKLENSKYYVGRTYNIMKQYEEHQNGTACSWTKLHKPINYSILISENVSIFDTDRYTKEFMSVYGIDNVRGGSYSKIMLSEVEKHFIQKEIWFTMNVCIRCGRLDHYIKDCNSKTTIDNVIIDDHVKESKIIDNNIINIEEKTSLEYNINLLENNYILKNLKKQKESKSNYNDPQLEAQINFFETVINCIKIINK
jgi:hypothetical protein